MFGLGSTKDFSTETSKGAELSKYLPLKNLHRKIFTLKILSSSSSESEDPNFQLNTHCLASPKASCRSISEPTRVVRVPEEVAV